MRIHRSRQEWWQDSDGTWYPRRDRSQWRSRSRAFLRRNRLLLIAAAVLGVIIFGRTGVLSAGTSSSANPAKPAATDRSTTSTTTVKLERRSYQPGDCVLWDQSVAGAEERATHVVPCDQSHLVEVAGSVSAQGRFDHFPSEAEWDAFLASDCTPVASAYLNGRLDPYGRLGVSSLQPLEDAWQQGDRTVWCGLSLNTPNRTLLSFAGKVADLPQANLRPPGTCLSATSKAVACATPHTWEVAGVADVLGDTPPPAPDDTNGWDALVGGPCAHVAQTYLGRDLSANESSGWDSMSPEGWAAGERQVECLITIDTNGAPGTTTGSLKRG